MGVASLVLGIIGIICAVIAIFAPIGWILVIIGLIIGIVDVVKKGKKDEKRGIGIAGTIICGIMFVVLLVESVVMGSAIFLVIKGNENIENASLIAQENQKNLFNSLYVNYEGIQKESTVKTLLRMENSKGTNLDEHYVSYKYDGKVESISTIFNKIEISSSYRISLEYDTDGYVNTIRITPINRNVWDYLSHAFFISNNNLFFLEIYDIKKLY